MQGVRDCHIIDGAAVVKYFAWLEQELLEKNNTTITEYSGATKLEQFRSMGKNFFDLSFPSISSVGENAAVIHYKPSEKDCKTITKDLIYLLDSGAQYL